LARRGVGTYRGAIRLAAWWAKLDQYRDIPFMPEGREQPPMPIDNLTFN
jgi:hypothetical protein